MQIFPDMLNFGQDLLGGAIAKGLGQARIGCEKAPLPRALENALHRLFEETAVSSLGFLQVMLAALDPGQEAVEGGRQGPHLVGSLHGQGIERAFPHTGDPLRQINEGSSQGPADGKGRRPRQGRRKQQDDPGYPGKLGPGQVELFKATRGRHDPVHLREVAEHEEPLPRRGCSGVLPEVGEAPALFRQEFADERFLRGVPQLQDVLALQVGVDEEVALGIHQEWVPRCSEAERQDLVPEVRSLDELAELVPAGRYGDDPVPGLEEGHVESHGLRAAFSRVCPRVFQVAQGPPDLLLDESLP